MISNWKLLSSIFMVFLKMGPITFGGGYALIPVIEREVVERKGWLRDEEVADVFAVSGSVPGAVAVNSATLIGYRIAGVAGALAALIGILIPTFCIMIALSLAYNYLKDNPKIEAAFLSIRATVVAMIAYAAIKISRTAIVDLATGVLAVATVLILVFEGSHIHPLWIIVFGATAGIGIAKIRARFGHTTKRSEEQQVFDYMI